jgi:hypothetical protein
MSLFDRPCPQGIMCAIQPQRFEPCNCFLWLGQSGESKSLSPILFFHLYFFTNDVIRKYICYFRGFIPMRPYFSTKISDALHCFFPCNGTVLTFLLGLGTLKIQTEDKPLRPHGLYQCRFRLTRWLSRCLRWKRRHHDALGSQRGKTSILTRSRRCRQRSRVFS